MLIFHSIHSFVNSKLQLTANLNRLIILMNRLTAADRTTRLTDCMTKPITAQPRPESAVQQQLGSVRYSRAVQYYARNGREPARALSHIILQLTLQNTICNKRQKRATLSTQAQASRPQAPLRLFPIRKKKATNR